MVEEAVAMFFPMVGHDVRMRVVVYRFQHPIDTIARHLKEVRWALCRLYKILICPTNMANECIHMLLVILNIFHGLRKEFIKMNLMYIRSFHNHYFIFLIIIFFFFCCRIASVQLMAFILVHESQLIDKPVLGVEN